MASLKKKDWCYLGPSLFLIFFGLILSISWPYIYLSILKQNLVLQPDSKSYSMWVETPLPMYLDIYLFNWTNAAEYAKNPSIKPHFEEVGPFIFREVHDRVNVTWNGDGTVSYNQTRNWTFVPEESVDLNTHITNMNIIALSAAHTTRYSSKALQYILDLVLRVTSSLYTTKPASEWLFDGMDLKLLKILNSKAVKDLVKLDLPIPDKFGFFYQRNMSAAYDGRFQVKTGKNELDMLGDVDLWNHKNKTDFFLDYCAMVNGSSGEIFPPLPNEPANFSLFISDVCSSLELKYKGKKEVSGITGTEFIGDATMLDNGELLPERRCFCEGECMPTGVRNLTRCRQGAPVFVSFPHFYLADKSYNQKVDGLTPNESLHQFQLTIEPTTGIPLDVRAQLQVNALLQPYSMYKMFKNVSKVLMPMMWFRQRAHINSPLVSQTNLLLGLRVGASAFFLCLAALGIIVIAARVYFVRRKMLVEDEEEPIISAPDEVR